MWHRKPLEYKSYSHATTKNRGCVLLRGNAEKNAEKRVYYCPIHPLFMRGKEEANEIDLPGSSFYSLVDLLCVVSGGAGAGGDISSGKSNMRVALTSFTHIIYSLIIVQKISVRPN